MASPARLRVAYIGAGGFSNACIYPQLGAHAVDLVAVCDLVEARAAAAARKYGFQQVYTDYLAMLDAERPDAVICVGGPVVHHQVGREVLRRGYPLYVQKSPAPTAAATRELAELAETRGVVCHVGFNLRSCAAGLAASREIAGEAFGPVSLVVVRYGLVAGATRRDAVFDQHCHAYDTLRWLGGEVADVSALAGRVPGDRGYVVAVRFASGAVGSVNFTSGQTPTKEFYYFEVTGGAGHYLTSHDFDLLIRRPGGPDEVLTMGTYGGPLGPLAWMGYVPDLANYFAAVRGDEPDRSPVGDAVGTMELCEEVYRQLCDQGVEP